MSEDTTQVHSLVEVPQVTSYVEQDSAVRTFMIPWDAPQDDAALFNAVGEWVKAQRAEHGHRFRLDHVAGGDSQVRVYFRVLPPRDAPALSVVADEPVAA